MITTTAAFVEALRGSHEVVVFATVVTPGSIVAATVTAVPAGALAVVSGTVTLDATANIRGTVTLVVNAPFPTSTGTTALAPYGTEIAVYRGVRYGNGKVEAVSLGVYVIQSVEQQAPFTGQLTITGSDRMSYVDQAKLEGPVNYPVGGVITTYGAVLADLLVAAYPSVYTVTVNWDDATNAVTFTVPIVGTGTDRLATITTMLTGLAKIAYFDGTGTLQVKSPVTVSAAAFPIDQGANGVFVGGSRTLTRTGAINTVVVTSEQAGSTSVPVIGVAQDTTSAMSVARAGIIAAQYTSPTVVDGPGAAMAAQTILAQLIGVPYVVQLTAIPAPFLEPYDVLTVVYPPDRAVFGSGPVTESHIIDSIAFPLSYAGTVSVNTRQSNVTGV